MFHFVSTNMLVDTVVYGKYLSGGRWRTPREVWGSQLPQKDKLADVSIAPGMALEGVVLDHANTVEETNEA